MPWVVAKGQVSQKSSCKIEQDRKTNSGQHEEVVAQEPENPPPVFNRYYHMFAKGELTRLVHDAANELGLSIGPQEDKSEGSGIEIVQDGWERSNYYVELRRWECK